ncbi:YajG family lipoprotein [Colwellia sp. E2M01]|nr:YajG family lipoprotein [Colwellia sp. E2M01]
MTYSTLKSIALSLVLLTIASCNSTPTHLVITPEIDLLPSNQLTGRNTQLRVIDMRTSPHIIQILEPKEPAIILSSQRRLEAVIQDILAQEWQTQGLTLTDTSTNKMTVSIEKAIISVDQASITYDTQSEIIIKVTVDNSKQTLTSHFKKRAHSEGALNPNISTLEEEFNLHLSEILKQVLISKDIKTFL